MFGLSQTYNKLNPQQIVHSYISENVHAYVDIYTHRHFSMLIAVVLPLIAIFPCSSRLFLRSSPFFHAHHGCFPAHRHFSMLIAVVFPLIGSFPCSSVVSADMA